MSQNTSHAVMAQRHEAHDSLDFFPTPAWATRALCEWLKAAGEPLSKQVVWEPACGEGHMALPLEEYFDVVFPSDVAHYPRSPIPYTLTDFLMPAPMLISGRPSWIITNPPFRLGEQFALTAIERTNAGVALLVRTAFLESADRHAKLFKPHPPSDILQFVERVPMQKGLINRYGSTATAYCWVVWRKCAPSGTHFHWLAPCRKRLERDSDYPARETVEATQ